MTPDSPFRPELAVIVPVRNDARRLAGCLAAIRRNDLHGRFELVVADNGSTDGSDRVARDAGAVVLSLPNRSVAELRNIAAERASAPMLAFVDADHLIVPDWWTAARETIAATGAAAVGAPYSSPDDATWVQRAYDRFRHHAAGVAEVDWLGSGNLVVTRGAFLSIGGFDTTLETCEDVDLCNRLRAAGHRIVRDARMVSIHLGDPASLRALFLAELWRGRDNIRVTMRGPLTWRALPSLIIPVVDLLLMVVVAAGLPFWSRGGRGIVGLALAGVFGAGCLRAARMTLGSSASNLRVVGQNLVVAIVYEVARALALVVRATHRTRRERAGA